MSSTSKLSYGNSKSYLGLSKFSCFCGKFGDLWRSGTAGNPGRLFVKCGMDKRCKFWKWEDELGGMHPNGMKTQVRGCVRSDSPAKPNSDLSAFGEIRSELTMVRYAIVLLAVVVAWLASKA